MRRDVPGVGPMYVACYVDDIILAAPSEAAANSFFAELSERFVLDEGKGKPVDFLLGMSIVQDLKAGTR